MKFQCEEISISDEEFSLSITFSEKSEDTLNYLNYEEIVNSNKKYIFLQLSYPEDEYEKYYATVEFSEFKKSGTIDKFKYLLSRDEFIVKSKDEEFKCHLTVSDEKYNEIKDVLKNIISGKDHLTIIE